MSTRYKEVAQRLFIGRLRLGAALALKFREGYAFSDLRGDLTAGIIVSMVAIPLAMALAIASGVSPQSGLYTVIIAGSVVALLGGSRLQVTGPTAAFVVVLVPVVQKFGLSGLLVAGFMAGILQVLMGLARLGRLIRFIPYPVTTGFTTGIAVVIAVLQLKDFFGLRIEHMPLHFSSKIGTLLKASDTFSPFELFVGAMTLVLLLLLPKINRRLPTPLVALAAVSIGAIIVKKWIPDFDITTIGDRFRYDIKGVIHHGIPQALPTFQLPWTLGDTSVSLDWIAALIPSAFTIAMLGAIESLLSAVVADGMAHTKHDPDAELVALGIGNMVCPFFGGIAATGALARTATNIRFGARSPLSAVIHALFTLLVVLLFAPYVAYLPMAALAALLLVVAYNMSEAKHFLHIVRVGPKSDVIVLLICFGLTVLVDMVAGVTVGVMLAALLFMKEMAALTSPKIFEEGHHPDLKNGLPQHVILYEISGPLFFGAAEHAAEALSSISHEFKVVVFIMDDVSIIDITGLVALESAVKKLTTHGRRVILAGVRPRVRTLMMKSNILADLNRVQFSDTLANAIETAEAL